MGGIARARIASSVNRLFAAFVLAALLLGAVPPARGWDGDRMAAAAQRLGPRAVSQAQALRPLLLHLAEAPDDETRLVAVNRFFNRRVLFRDDIDVWGTVDHWASPLETLDRGEGDCEDYAIAKYFSLVASGMPASRLRLVYVRAEFGGPGGPVQAHMVLAYYPAVGAEPLILDNLVEEVRPASRRPDLTPVFSFNSEGLWEGVTGRDAGEPLLRLSRWREVLSKAKEEGFQ